MHEPPAGPPKLHYTSTARTFFKFWPISITNDEVIAKSQIHRKTSTERTKLEREHSWREPWPCSIFCSQIFWNLSLSECETTCIFLESDSFSRKSLDRIARNLHFCQIIFGKSACHFQLDFPWHCSIKYFSSRGECNLRLYKPCRKHRGGEAPFQVLSPRQGRPNSEICSQRSFFPKFS